MKTQDISILVIEDNPADVEILHFHLSETKFSKAVVKNCDTLKEGMKMLSSTSFDILLLDLALPDSNGAGSVKIVTERFPTIPVVVLTGQIEDDIAIEAMKNGAQDSLSKQEVLPELLQKTISHSVERNTAYQKIAKSEKQYQVLINTMTEALLQVDVNNDIVFVNDRFSKLTGYNKSEVIGENAVELLNYNEDNFFLTDKGAQRKNGVADKYEMRLKTKSGDTLWTLVSGSPIYDERNAFMGSIGVITDVSKQKKLTTTLSEQEEGLRVIYENSKVGITRIDFFTATFLQLNKYFYRLLERSHKYLLNRNFFETVHPDSLQKTKDMFNSFKNNGNPTAEEEIKLTTKTGKVIDVLLSLSLVTPADKPEYFVAVFKDITPLKQSERKLAENSKALIEFNKELQATLAKQQETEKELLRKNKELDTFVYKASHDLKGPLASIKGLSQIALKELKEEESIQFIEKIASSSLKLDHILNELINVSRASLSELKIEEISTSELVTEVVQSLQYSKEAEGVDIMIDVKEGDYKTKTSKELLHSIILNLVQNSIKYKNTDKKPYVKISVKKINNTIQFTVTDNGVGIDPQYKAKVFDMFFRANNVSDGSGLGLYIVRKSVEKLGGAVDLNDNPGGGTVITINIPIK